MRNLRIVPGVLFSIFLSTALQAAPLSWDPTQSTGSSLGGVGNWDQLDPFWFNGASDIAWTNANNDDAIFSGTAGTVTLTENISAGNLYFTNATGNYAITNATGAEVLTIAGAIDTGGGDHTIGAPIGNSSTLSKNGVGRLHLPVDNTSSIIGSVTIHKGDVSIENNNGAGQVNSITVADGAALVLNGGANGLTEYNAVTISGSGITNSGAIRNLSGVTTFNGQITLGESNSMIYVDTDASLVYSGQLGPLTDNGNNYNLIISGSGTGNVHLGATSIGGTLMVLGPASCYSYLNGVSPTAWTNTYISSGGTFYVENNNGFGNPPSSLITNSVLLDGGTIVSTGSYTMYANDGITVTTNGGTLSNATSSTWVTCNIYSQSNTPVTLTGTGSFRLGGAAGATLGTVNLGTGAIIKSGGGDFNMGYANPSLEIYSNLVINGGSLSFNYDQANGTSSLGALPSGLNQSNIILNGGSLHAGHTTTIGATRGIYVGSGGGTIEDVTGGGNVTVASPISGPGNMNFPLGKSASTTTVTLTANNSYTGTTTVGASSIVSVGSGGSTGTLGTGNTADNGTLTFNRTGSYSYGGVISGGGVVNKTGSGTVTLSGANTYSGNTTISAGALFINNTSGSGTGTGSVAVNSGGTLGGIGAISGAVTVAAGGTLSPGASAGSLGTLTINNSLSLAGNVAIAINKSLSPSNSSVVVTSSLVNSGSGTVKITNLGPILQPGDTFQLFSQPVSGGGPLLVIGGSAIWNNNLALDGTISVASVPVPAINSVSTSGANLVFSGTNGTISGPYTLLSTTNISLPITKWTTVLTGSYDSSGNFSVTTGISTNPPQKFFILESQ